MGLGGEPARVSSGRRRLALWLAPPLSIGYAGRSCLSQSRYFDCGKKRQSGTPGRLCGGLPDGATEMTSRKTFKIKDLTLTLSITARFTARNPDAENSLTTP